MYVFKQHQCWNVWMFYEKKKKTLTEDAFGSHAFKMKCKKIAT